MSDANSVSQYLFGGTIIINMIIGKFTIKGYRSFKTEQTLNFAAPNEDRYGLTLIVGENNSGKTSLLEALKLSPALNSDNTLRTSDLSDDKVELELSLYDQDSRLVQSLRPIRDGSFSLKNINIDDIYKDTDVNQRIVFVPSRRFWSTQVQNEMDLDNVKYNAASNYSMRLNTDNFNPMQVASMLRTVELDDNLYKESIALMQQIFPDFYSFSTVNEDYKNIVYTTKSGIQHRADFLGDGVVSILTISAFLLLYPDRMIVIDEPELSLHPLAQRKLAKLLFERSKNQQILLSTHSPHFIESSFFEKGAVINRVIKRNDSQSLIFTAQEYETYSSIMSTAEWQKPHSFDVLAKEIFFQDNILFLEGQQDVSLLKRVDKFDSSINIFGYGVGGHSKFKVALQLALDIGVAKAAVIIDAGEEEDDTVKLLRNNFKDYKIIQWKKKDIRDKVSTDKKSKNKDGYFTESGNLKPANKLEDFLSVIEKVNSYFTL